jgi:hypothetical protein
VANSEHLEILDHGVYYWNQWREEHPDITPDLTRAYLREANLVGYDLRGATLHGAMLLGADLSSADLRMADFADADVRFVELNGARLAGARFERSKGVDAGVLRRAQRPQRLQRRFQATAIPGMAAAVAVLAVVMLVRGLGPPDPAGPEAGEAAAGPALITQLHADPFADMSALLLSLRFEEWSVRQAIVRGPVLTIQLSVENVDESVYLPTLVAACDVLQRRPEAAAIQEIRILEESGRNGWAYDRPRNCPAIMRAPTHMLRLAAGADTLRWQAK